MMTSQTAKVVSNTVYAIGAVIFAVLIGLVIFGAEIIPDPNAMIAWSMREAAVVGLAVGTIPMLFACMAVYKFNGIKQSTHKARNLFLIFLPAFICGACLLICIGIWVTMMAQAVLHVLS